MHFGPVTEIDQQTWRRLSIGKAGPREEAEEVISHGSTIQTDSVSPASPATSSLRKNPCSVHKMTTGIFHRYARSAWELLLLLKSLLKPVTETAREDVVLTGSFAA